MIKGLGMSSKVKACFTVIGLKDDQEVSFDSEYVASTFNNFFTRIVSKLVSKLGISDFSPSEIDSFYETWGVSQDSCSLFVVSEEEICKLLDSLNVHKSIVTRYPVDF